MEDELLLAREEARFDLLTGLYNRNGFQHCMDVFFQQKEPLGTLILFDLDNFKKINDFEGHPEGDRILTCFAQCLRDSFRTSDHIGRLGGDEFIVLMQNTTSQELLKMRFQSVLNKVRIALREYYDKYQVSVSIGAVPITKKDTDYETLYKSADTALYIAKNMGKDQYYINKI